MGVIERLRRVGGRIRGRRRAEADRFPPAPSAPPAPSPRSSGRAANPDAANPDAANPDADPAQVRELLYPRPRFQGEFTPENLAFDSNLQEFAQRVVYICSLENSGKITPDDAHRQIKALFRALSASHKGLGIDGG